MTRARRVDSNHAQVLDAFRRCGCAVFDTSRLGNGFGDAVIALGRRICIVEVKDGTLAPSRRRLTPAETEFHRIFAPHALVISSVAEAIAWAQNKGGK